MDKSIQSPAITNETPSPLVSSSHFPPKFHIGLVIVITLIAGGIGLYFAGTKKNQPVPLPGEPSPTEIQSTATPNASPSADWKTFISRQGKYSIKYPNDYELTERETSSSLGGSKEKYPYGDKYVILRPLNLMLNYSITIGYFSVPLFSSSKDVLEHISDCDKRNADEGKGPKEKPIIINGIEGLVYEDGVCLSESKLTNIYVINKDRAYLIQVTHKDIYKNVQKDVDQILSTFRFD